MAFVFKMYIVNTFYFFFILVSRCVYDQIVEHNTPGSEYQTHWIFNDQ